MRQTLAENRRALIIGGAGLGILVLVLLARLLTSGGGAPATFTPTPSPSAPVAGAPGAVTTTTSAAPAEPGGTPVYTSKDPFIPLVDINAGAGLGASTSGAAGATGGGSSGSGTGSTGASGTTSTTVGGASGAGAAPGGSTSPGSPKSGQFVQVLDVHNSGSTAEATVEVSGAQYQVSPGETFAGNYYVVDLSTSAQCGDFTHGGAPFRACKGGKVLK